MVFLFHLYLVFALSERKYEIHQAGKVPCKSCQFEAQETDSAAKQRQLYSRKG